MSCTEKTVRDGLGTNADRLEYFSNCVKRLYCKDSSKNYTFQKNDSANVNACEPQGVDCSPPTAGEYLCNKTIPSTHDLGDSDVKTGWKACRDWCAVDTKCEGWTFNPKKQCQKKKKAEYIDKDNYISGPFRPSTVTLTPSPTTSPTVTPTATPTPTPVPSTDWWTQKSALGPNWAVVAGVVFLLLMLSCSGLAGVVVASKSS